MMDKPLAPFVEVHVLPGHYVSPGSPIITMSVDQKGDTFHTVGGLVTHKATPLEMLECLAIAGWASFASRVLLMTKCQPETKEVE